MRSLKLLTVTLSAVVISAALSPAARADEWDKKTTVTFSQPVEVPGVVLPPGTYVFKLLDSTSDRNIVQIFNEDESRIYATILAIPDYRMKPADKTVITFEETPANTPEAIQAWFYPGDEYGQEFVYPKARAMELAKANNRAVPSMPAAMAANITKPARSASAPTVQAMKQAPIRRQQPSGGEVEIAQASRPSMPSPSPANSPTINPAQHRKQLPKTAGEWPLAGLMGLLSVGLAFGVRLARVRSRS